MDATVNKRIRFVATNSGLGEVFVEGHEYDLPILTALEFLRYGQAVPAETPRDPQRLPEPTGKLEKRRKPKTLNQPAENE